MDSDEDGKYHTVSILQNCNFKDLLEPVSDSDDQKVLCSAPETQFEIENLSRFFNFFSQVQRQEATLEKNQVEAVSVGREDFPILLRIYLRNSNFVCMN